MIHMQMQMMGLFAPITKTFLDYLLVISVVCSYDYSGYGASSGKVRSPLCVEL